MSRRECVITCSSHSPLYFLPKVPYNSRPETMSRLEYRGTLCTEVSSALISTLCSNIHIHHTTPPSYSWPPARLGLPPTRATAHCRHSCSRYLKSNASASHVAIRGPLASLEPCSGCHKVTWLACATPSHSLAVSQSRVI